MSGCVTENLEMLLERDSRVSQILLESRTDSVLGQSLLDGEMGVYDGLAQEVNKTMISF